MISKLFRATVRLARLNTALRPTIIHRRSLSSINTNPYVVLGLQHGASSEEIKKAYLRLVKTHHPDHKGDPKKFIAVRAAYEALQHKKLSYAQRSPANAPAQSSYQKTEAQDPPLSAINSFSDLDKILAIKNKFSYLAFLTKLGREKLRQLIGNRSGDLALLILNVLEEDRAKLISLIGEDFIAERLHLSHLFGMRDCWYTKNRALKFPVLSWEEHKKLFKLLGLNIVLKCDLKKKFKDIYDLFGQHACDQFLEFIGEENLIKYVREQLGFSTHIYKQGLTYFSDILGLVSKEMQSKILSSTKIIDTIKPHYLFSFHVVGTLSNLHPSNHQLFLNIFGKKGLEEIKSDSIIQSYKFPNHHIPILFKSLRSLFDEQACDQLAGYIGPDNVTECIVGDRDLNIFVCSDMNTILKTVSKEMQARILCSFNSTGFSKIYDITVFSKASNCLHNIIYTLEALHPSNYKLFLNDIIGKNKLDRVKLANKKYFALAELDKLMQKIPKETETETDQRVTKVRVLPTLEERFFSKQRIAKTDPAEQHYSLFDNF